MLTPPPFSFNTKFILKLSVRDVGKNFGAAVSDCFVYTSGDEFFFPLLALQPPLGVVFYSPLVGFSLLAYEVS